MKQNEIKKDLLVLLDANAPTRLLLWYPLPLAALWVLQAYSYNRRWCLSWPLVLTAPLWCHGNAAYCLSPTFFPRYLNPIAATCPDNGPIKPVFCCRPPETNWRGKAFACSWRCRRESLMFASVVRSASVWQKTRFWWHFWLLYLHSSERRKR